MARDKVKDNVTKLRKVRTDVFSCKVLSSLKMQGFILVLIAFCSSANANGATQKFLLHPGWNLLTFQVLPNDRDPQTVFAAMISESGNALYSANPGANKLRAVVSARREGATLVWEKFVIGEPPTFPGTTSTPQPPAIDFAAASDLTRLEFARGYFVFLENILTNSEYTLIGELPATGAGMSLETGWNLVGIVGNLPDLKPINTATESPRKINVLSVFKQSDLEKITAVVRWDARRRTYQYYYPREPERSEFQFLEADLAHWVQTNSSLTVQPNMVVQAVGDSDVPPLSEVPLQDSQPWNPGPEDTAIHPPHLPAIFHTAETQEFLQITKGQNSLTLPIYNKGGGILAWNATVRPYTGAVAIPSVALTSRSDVKLILSLKRERGITTSEADGIELRVDRTHLPPGTYLARLEVTANTGQTKNFTLIVDVGGLEGQWKGTATIETVNGKRNPVADIDLYIHVFKDNVPGSRQLRGIIDSQETLLWPADAQLMGHIADFSSTTGVDPNYSSRFVLSGGYTLPPGDINRFPFDRFPEPGGSPAPQLAQDRDTGLRYLTNAEGDRFYLDLADRVQVVEASGTIRRQPNFTNPLNRFISREVELSGMMSGTDISQGGADVLTGEYYETILGMLPQPLHLRGHFRLVRKGHTPFERRPTIKAFYETPNGGRSISAAQSFGEPANEKITVGSHILINRVVVVVAHDIPDVKHTLTLTGPGTTPKTITLHNRQRVGPAQYVVYDSDDEPLNTLGLLSPPELRGAKPLPAPSSTGLDALKYEEELRNSLAKYVVSKPRESLSAFAGDDAFGDWRLKLTNNDNSTRNMLGWSLLIYGTPVSTLQGRIVVEGSDDSDRFNDVDIRVLGLNANLGSVLTRFDKTSGQFSISYLPGIRIDVVATKPGYPPTSIDGLNTNDDPRGYRDGLQGVIPGDQTLIPSGVIPREFTITFKQPPSKDDEVSVNAVSFNHRNSSAPPPQVGPASRVNAYPRTFNVPSTSGNVVIESLQLSYTGPLPSGVTEGQVRWQFEGDGTAAITSTPTIIAGRSPVVRLMIPQDSFTSANNFMLGLRPKAILGNNTNEVKFDDWVVVVLTNPPAGSVSTTRLIQASVLVGFGGFTTDDAEKRALQAQKTDVAKVDVDRLPLIDQATNPNLDFRLDGVTESGDGEAEDTDLHPRNFRILTPNQNGNRFAYAEIIPSPDHLFKKLIPVASGAVPDYDDRNKNINGRDINAPNEPVRIFTAIGDRIIDQCVSVKLGEQIINQCGSATNGKVRISAGTNPGPSAPPQ